MRLSTHDAYLSHLSSSFTAHADDRPFWKALGTYTEELSCLLDLSLDPVRDDLEPLYCPTGQGDPRDPVTLLRSWLLQTLCREGSPAVWAQRLRREPVLAVLAGFMPGDTPGASTLRDVLARLADGPYAVRSRQDASLSQRLAGRHRRRLDDATKARREAADAAGLQQSALLANVLLTQVAHPRNPYVVQGRLEHLFLKLALTPTLAANLLPDDLTVAGDGTVEESAASKQGFRACGCPPGSRCGCQRDYLSATAQFCYDTQHGWRFGDRSYTISMHVNGHDVPLMTILPGGNESDFTLSLSALDRLLNLLEHQGLPLRITTFLGDGHHDAGHPKDGTASTAISTPKALCPLFRWGNRRGQPRPAPQTPRPQQAQTRRQHQPAHRPRRPRRRRRRRPPPRPQRHAPRSRPTPRSPSSPTARRCAPTAAGCAITAI